MEAYYNKRYDMICEEAGRCDIAHTAELHNEFTFFSTNLEHFLPLVPVCLHEQLFRKSIAYHRMGALDLEFGAAGHLPEVKGWTEDWVARLRQRPGIVASAHTGAHLLIGVLLARAGIPFALLAASHLMERLNRTWRAIAKAYPGTELPLIVDASSPLVLRRLVSLATAGLTLLVYWDGRQGIGNLTEAAGGVAVPFLGQHLLLRRGVPFVAQAAGVPIYPLLCFRQQDRSVACFPHAEITAEHMPPARFAGDALGTIAAHFASLLIHFPAQWYNWPHLQHQVLPHRYVMETGRMLSSCYGILKGPRSYFLFERKTYRATELAENQLVYLKNYTLSDTKLDGNT